MMVPMRRPIALLALWLTAAIVCTTLGWFTVGIVSGQSRESSLPPLVQTTTTLDECGGQAWSGHGRRSRRGRRPRRPRPPRPRPRPEPRSRRPRRPSTPTLLPVRRSPAPRHCRGPQRPRCHAHRSRRRAPRSTAGADQWPSTTTASTGTVTLLWAMPNDGFTMDVHATGPDEGRGPFRERRCRVAGLRLVGQRPAPASRGAELTPRPGQERRSARRTS